MVVHVELVVVELDRYEGDMMQAVAESYRYLTSNGIAQVRNRGPHERIGTCWYRHIGCGNISPAYFKAAQTFEILTVVACADLNMESAQARAEEFECQAQTVEELLANDEVELVINLTIPAVHAAVSIQALEAGKHVHCEKPLAVELADGQRVVELAKEKGLRVGCAPDTFLGAGAQTCRKVIDDGWLGKVVGGTAFMMSRGPEHWHPNPAFFYKPAVVRCSTWVPTT